MKIKVGENMEEWISLNEYTRRYKVSSETAKKLIADGNIECRKTKGGYYKIKVGGKIESKEYEEIKKENERLRATLNNINSILKGVIQMKDLSYKQKYLLLKNALGFTGIVVTYVAIFANYFIKQRR